MEAHESHAYSHRSFVEEGYQNPERYPNNEPGAAAPLSRSMIRLIGVVVAVVDEVIRDGMTMGCVEALQQGLGDFFLMYLDLLDEAVGLLGTEGMNVVPVEVDVLQVGQLINLILTDGRLILLPVGDVKGLIDHVGVNPCLRGLWDSGVMGSNSDMTAMDVGVGEACPGDAHGGPTPSCPDGVVSSTRTDAQGGTLLPKVPTNSGEEFDAASESEEAHGLCGVKEEG